MKKEKIKRIHPLDLYALLEKKESEYYDLKTAVRNNYAEDEIIIDGQKYLQDATCERSS